MNHQVLYYSNNLKNLKLDFLNIEMCKTGEVKFKMTQFIEHIH